MIREWANGRPEFPAGFEDPRLRKVVRIGSIYPQFGFHRIERYEGVLECGCCVPVAAGQEYAICFNHLPLDAGTETPAEKKEEECRLLCRIIQELSPDQEVEIPPAIENDPARLRLFIISYLQGKFWTCRYNKGSRKS